MSQAGRSKTQLATAAQEIKEVGAENGLAMGLDEEGRERPGPLAGANYSLNINSLQASREQMGRLHIRNWLMHFSLGVINGNLVKDL